MLRRQILFMATVVSMTFAMPALAFTEGTDYVKLDQPLPNAEGKVTKLFSYDCPFCYKYAKAVDKIVMSKVPELTFEPMHLRTKGKYGIEGSKLMAVALVADETTGLKPLDAKSNFHKVEMALYKAYHDKKQRWNEGADAFLKTGLDAIGMERVDFDKACDDPKVKTLIEYWEAAYPIAKMQGVPAYVVDGKYLIMTKSITSIDGMVNLMKELASK